MNPKIVNVGAGIVLTTKTDFINGYQAGHLAFMAERTTHPQPYTDEEMTELFFERLDDLTLSSLYSTGFVAGWLHTLASKGTKNNARTEPTSPAVSEKYAVGEGK